jgi:outer membrane protein assembly factor BamD
MKHLILRHWLLALVVLTMMPACATDQSGEKSITARARDRYISGMDELLSGNYTEAILHFQEVSKNPGYVKYAALSRLRIGDALFQQEKYDSAIQVYRAFLKQYDGNPNTGYAQFMVGHAFHAQIPSDWWLAPPSSEREQAHLVYAENALRRFVDMYPAHRLVPKARRLLDDCERRLFEHEMYVVRFYRTRQKPAAVVLRLEGAFRRFPTMVVTEQNYLILAKAYADTNAVENATAMYLAYLDRFPNGKFREQAHKSLRVLESANPGQS